jgi:hypothetical protein
VGQVPRRRTDTCAGVGVAQGVGLRRLRHHPRVGAHRPPLGGRWPGGVGLGSGHRRALGALVFLLAPPAVTLPVRRPVRPILPLALTLNLP